MEIIIIVIGILIIAILGLIAKKIYGQKQTGLTEGLLLLQNQINEIVKTLDQKLGESTKVIHSQMSESAQVSRQIIKEVTQELTKLNESQKQFNDLNAQLKVLQDILKNPKQRGILGEYLLENTLKNILPPTIYQMQYPFSDGVKVDAVIFYQDKIIPIDSKFSLENYNRFIEAKTDEERKKFETALYNDLKTRIDETSKYIKPEENTLNMALMYIPSEALYYDLLINKVGSVGGRNLIEYAGEKKVTIVSPTTFQAYLITLMIGLRQIEINKSAEKLRKNITELQKHLTKYEEFLIKLGDNLNKTLNIYNKSYEEFQKIDKDIYKITGAEKNSTPLIESLNDDLEK
jgi:DNA recombination protein RmuC